MQNVLVITNDPISRFIFSMKSYDNQVNQEKGSMLIDEYNYVKYTKIRVFSYPRFPAYGQNRIRIFRYAGKCGSEKARILAYFILCTV